MATAVAADEPTALALAPTKIDPLLVRSAIATPAGAATIWPMPPTAVAEANATLPLAAAFAVTVTDPLLLCMNAEALPPAIPAPTAVVPAATICTAPGPACAKALAVPEATALAFADTLIAPLFVRDATAVPPIAVPSPTRVGATATTWRTPAPAFAVAVAAEPPDAVADAATAIVPVLLAKAMA